MSRIKIAIGNSKSLTSWGRATIEHLLTLSDKSRDQLRGFVLNHTSPLEKQQCGNISAQNSPRDTRRAPGASSIPSPRNLLLHRDAADGWQSPAPIDPADKSAWLTSKAVGLHPAFHKPERMGAAGGEGFG